MEELKGLPVMLSIRGYDHIEGLEAFSLGMIQVQDVTSALVGEAASPKRGDYIIDVCAAPGGKSLHLADKLEGTGLVEARDLSVQKVSLIEENRIRCGYDNVRTVVWDALQTDEDASVRRILSSRICLFRARNYWQKARYKV